MAFQESGSKPPVGNMRWNRLTKNLCPKCTSRSLLGFENNLVICDCGFKISPHKMKDIVMNILEDQGRDDEWEDWNQEICGGCGKPDAICSCFD